MIIDIEENSILFEGGRQIIIALGTNKTITKLNLSMDYFKIESNKIDDKNCKELLRYINDNNLCTRVNLSNYITNHSWE